MSIVTKRGGRFKAAMGRLLQRKDSMAEQGRTYRPEMSDAAVMAKTGKTWDQWFALLDRAGAARLGHREIVKLAAKIGEAGPWWRQMVSVEYERARGLRRKHETATGFSVSATKTLIAGVAALYAATVDAKQRKKWFPEGELKVSSQTEDKYFRGAWNGSSRLEINFYTKPGGKAQITVQIGKLAKKSDVERERMIWKAALAKLAFLLEG